MARSKRPAPTNGQEAYRILRVSQAHLATTEAAAAATAAATAATAASATSAVNSPVVTRAIKEGDKPLPLPPPPPPPASSIPPL